MSKRIKRQMNPSSSDEMQPNSLQQNLASSNDHEFLAPNEIFSDALELFYWMTKKHFDPRSFSELYLAQGPSGIVHELMKIRQRLKSNGPALEKCLAINRLCTALTTNTDYYVQSLENLYSELQARMSSTMPQVWGEGEQILEVKKWRHNQINRRLFYVRSGESGQLQTLLTLQQCATNLFRRLIQESHQDPTFWRSRGQDRLTELINYSFIIVAQPTDRTGHPVTQYQKNGKSHSADIKTRVICLLDAKLLHTLFRLSSISVTVCPWDMENSAHSELQPSVEWETRTITSSEGGTFSFLYFELRTIELQRLDAQGKCPLFNSMLLELEFRFNFQLMQPIRQIPVNMRSEPFSVCSHPSHLPEWIARLLLMQIEQSMTPMTTPESQQTLLLSMIQGYQILTCGVPSNPSTLGFMKKVLRKAYDCPDQPEPRTIYSIYQESTAKLLAQIRSFARYPVLSMMYADGVFLGIHDPEVDCQLKGTPGQPNLYLRFNALDKQKRTDEAIVRYIAHSGQLIRATFDMKVFPYELCRLIFESNSPAAQFTKIYSLSSSRVFQDFNLYFDHELYRISGIPPSDPTKYNPLVPTIWQVAGRYAKSSEVPSVTEESSTTSIDQDMTPGYCDFTDQQYPTTIDDATSKSFSVNAAFDWNNPSQLTLTVQFHDQYIQCSEELIALVTQKLRETFQFNDNGNHQS